jgi:hypothetical protein
LVRTVILNLVPDIYRIRMKRQAEKGERTIDE